jgi:hypothetical protein
MKSLCRIGPITHNFREERTNILRGQSSHRRPVGEESLPVGSPSEFEDFGIILQFSKIDKKSYVEMRVFILDIMYPLNF